MSAATSPLSPPSTRLHLLPLSPPPLTSKAPHSRYCSFKDELPHLKALVQWSGTVPAVSGKVPAMSWSGFNELGGSAKEVEKVLARSEAVRPGHCATLI